MRSLRRPVALAALVAALAFPLGVLASHGFSDVPASNTFHDDIDAIADAGVTTGCAAAKYCPKDNVTREQMAAFLNRLGALGPGTTPVVNATKLDGKDASQFLEAADIEMVRSGGWTVPLSHADEVTIYPSVDATKVTSALTSTPLLVLDLDAPASIGNQSYGLKGVSVCFKASAGSPTWTGIEVKELLPTASGFLVTDPTDHSMSSAGCVYVADATPSPVEGGVRVEVALSFPASGSVFFTNAVATWTPVS